MKRLVIVCTLLAMLGAACSSDSTDADTPTTTTTAAPSDASDAGAGETTTTAAAASTTEATTTTAAPEPASGSLETCVVGRWVLDPVAFFEDVLAEQPQQGIDGEFAFVDGEYVLIIDADGTFQSLRDNWSFAVTSDFGNLEVTVNDSDIGTWSLARRYVDDHRRAGRTSGDRHHRGRSAVRVPRWSISDRAARGRVHRCHRCV